MCAYLFSETKDNEPSVFATGARLVKEGFGPILLIDDIKNTNSGYPGGPNWRTKLIKRGIPERKIRLVPLIGGIPFSLSHSSEWVMRGVSLNTLSEAIDVAAFAKRENCDRLIIVAPPFHQLRCFISMVTAIGFAGDPSLRIYNQVGESLPWQKEARHSQGTLTARRADLILSELAKIVKYQREGIPNKLLSTKGVLEYLAWRDSS